MKKIPVSEIHANPQTFVGRSGLVTVDTSTNTINIHDGITPGGTPASGLSRVQLAANASGVVGVNTSGSLVLPSGGVFSVVGVTPYVNTTATGVVFTGACELAGYDCTAASGNITIYDALSSTGTVIVPTTALTLGRVEFLYKRALNIGCYVVLSSTATVNVLVG